jgi:hypothetical protein
LADSGDVHINDLIVPGVDGDGDIPVGKVLLHVGPTPVNVFTEGISCCVLPAWVMPRWAC